MSEHVTASSPREPRDPDGKTATQAAAPRTPPRTLSPWSLLLGGAVIAALVLGEWVWLIAILGLALLITVHEFGHFIAAKAFGMRVEKFYVGFPPAALRRTWGETEYGIGIIPLGGFCKISGMMPEEPVGEGVVAELLADAEDGHLDRTYTVAELDDGLKELKSRVHAATADAAAADPVDIAEWRRLAKVLEKHRAGLVAPGGAGDPVYYKKAIWKRNVTIAAGPLMNFVAAAVILMLFYGIQGLPTGTTLTLNTIEKGSPAATAGLVAGDKLVGAGGQTWTTWNQATTYLRARLHQTIDLRYQPAGGGAVKTVTVTLAPKPGEPKVGYLGVSPNPSYQRQGPIKAFTLGISGFKDVVVGTFTGFWWLLSGKISATGPNGAVGPVGIINVSRQAVQQSWYPVLLAFLSFNLGLINLLPILPFDGGHIAINVVEKIRGRRLNTVVFERMIGFGTVLLVMLFIFLTFNDVKRLFGG